MTEISFYHLTAQPLEMALPRLLERVLEAGHRALVRVGSQERLEALDGALWTYDEASFLPHGTKQTGFEAEQPIYITDGEDNPNGADILVLVDGLEAADVGDFARCLYMFDGRSGDLTDLARAHWQAFRDAGHDVTYWQQGESGGWEKKS